MEETLMSYHVLKQGTKNVSKQKPANVQ